MDTKTNQTDAYFINITLDSDFIKSFYLMNDTTDDEWKKSTIGHKGENKVDENIRKSHTKTIDVKLPKKEKKILNTYLKPLIPSDGYKVDFENINWQMIRYDKGDKFNEHIDGKSTQTHIGSILIFPPNINNFVGGNLILHYDKSKKEIIKTEEFKKLTMVAFKFIGHEVTEILNGIRYVIKGNLEIKKRKCLLIHQLDLNEYDKILNNYSLCVDSDEINFLNKKIQCYEQKILCYERKINQSKVDIDIIKNGLLSTENNKILSDIENGKLKLGETAIVLKNYYEMYDIKKIIRSIKLKKSNKLLIENINMLEGQDLLLFMKILKYFKSDNEQILIGNANIYEIKGIDCTNMDQIYINFDSNSDSESESNSDDCNCSDNDNKKHKQCKSKSNDSPLESIELNLIMQHGKDKVFKNWNCIDQNYEYNDETYDEINKYNCTIIFKLNA
jgi:hypothetical protein